MSSTTSATMSISSSSCRKRSRRLSVPHRTSTNLSHDCYSLSVSALDLPSAPTLTLASVRSLVLDHLSELENRLLDAEEWVQEYIHAGSECTLEEVRAWASDALEILSNIRDDITSQLPPIDSPKVESFVRSYMMDIPAMDELKGHLPDLPDVRRKLSELDIDVREKFNDVRSHLKELKPDFNHPLKYLPALSSHLQSLNTHLSEFRNSSISPLHLLPSTSNIIELLDKISSAPVPHRLFLNADGESSIETATRHITRAIQRSLGGSRLVNYADLPYDWQNNPFVSRGYRFIPLENWHLILLSVFVLHNETANIHTHMIPLVHSVFRRLTFAEYDLPETIYMTFAHICLLSSVLWHTMSGCADPFGMELCARVDYVGIGWLISASVSTVIYYAFYCQPTVCRFYLSLCVLMGVLGSVLPFARWFNERHNKNFRVLFFVAMAFTAVAPLAHLCYSHSVRQMHEFISPIYPSLLSYIIGLVFYVTHFPERYFHLNDRLSRWTDWLGGGSHAIWHLCIVIGIYTHLWGITEMKTLSTQMFGSLTT